MGKEQLHADSNTVLSSTIVVGNETLNAADCEKNGIGSPSGMSEVKAIIKPQEVGEKLRNVPNIYREDVVRCNEKGDQIGVVLEVAGDSDSESDITDDEDDEDDNNSDGDNGDGGDDADIVGDDNEINKKTKTDGCKITPLTVDQVRVVWMDHSVTNQNSGDLAVVDRGHLQGDIVAAVSDPMGKLGVVVGVNITVDLLAADGSTIKDVSSRDLIRVRDFIVGDYVVNGHWLGRVDEVLDNLTVSFDDGSICKVVKVDPLRLKPVSKGIQEDGNFPYYPGQRVKASSSSVFKNARWLSGLWKANRMEGTVTEVSVGSTFVYWIASAGYGLESSSAPSEEQSPKNLKLLSCFAHANWQVGDWCLLPFCEKDSSRVKSDNPVKCGLVSNDLESELGLEVGSSEKLELEFPSFKSSDSTDLDINVEDKLSTESTSTNFLSVSKEPMHANASVHRKKWWKVMVRKDKKARKKEENFEKALVIIGIRTKVDVAWQDGEVEFGRVSTTLIPIDNPCDQDFLAEQYVVEKVSDEDEDVCESRRVGVVKSVNAKDRTACVRWLKPVARPEDPREFDKEEVVSVYELEQHPDYDYCYGDVVVRLSPVSVAHIVGSETPAEELEQQTGSNEAEQHPEKKKKCKKAEDSSNNEANVDFSDFSWVGCITSLRDGDIEVTWADGMVSTVGPQAIYVVDRDDDDDFVGVGSDSSDAASWETVSEDEKEPFQNAGEEEAGLQSKKGVIPDIDETVNSEENDSGRNGALSVPLAALGFVTRLATELFARGKKNVQLYSNDSDENVPTSQGTLDASNRGTIESESISPESNSGDSDSVQLAHEKEEEVKLLSEAEDIAAATETLCTLRSEDPDFLSEMMCNGDATCSFKRFDTAKDPLDHFFLGANEQSNNGRKWLKKVQQDWTILQKNLPGSIYVRVYEDRMDLLRAAIVGAYGTPYQDGLFFFDFHLPQDYPHVPPSAHYHSGGWRINPNLYEEGKVCLSLLNTWTGRGNEVWDPSSSSILQVLVSLQGLVLNSKPYYNEAGYDKQVGTAEGEKNSLTYNENTFLLNCKYMMYLLRKPPKDFEEFIKDHFRRRGYFFLRACDAYMKGYLIGSLKKDASLSDKSSDNSTSVGFKLMLAKLVPKLITSLSEVGADVDEFKHLQQE